jgi:hypothetical protein
MTGLDGEFLLGSVDLRRRQRAMLGLPVVQELRQGFGAQLGGRSFGQPGG